MSAPRPGVRLLTRRTGVRRPLTNLTNEPLLEVAEVFRIDVVRHLFEGREPMLRVKFIITQTPPSELDLQEDYPLEYDDILTTPVPPQHPAERWARALYRAIFEGRVEDWIDLDAGYRAGPQGSLQQTLELYGRPESKAWDRMPADQFFKHWTMNCYNAGLHRYSDDENLVEERNLLIQSVEHLLKTDPQEVLALGPLLDDFVQVMLVLAWTLNKESEHPLLN